MAEMIIVSEEYLNELTPNHLGDRKRIKAGLINIGKDTMKHKIIDDFLIGYPLMALFTVDDVKAKLDDLYPSRDFLRASLRSSLWKIMNRGFPYKTGGEHVNAGRGRVTRYFLHTPIEKIKYEEDKINDRS